MESYLSVNSSNFDKKQVIEIKNFIENHFDKIIIESKEIPEIIKIMSFDKKNNDNTPKFVLIKKLGIVETDKIVSEKDIIEAFKFYSS